MIITEKEANNIINARNILCGFCQRKYPTEQYKLCDKCLVKKLMTDTKINYHIKNIDRNYMMEDMANLVHINSPSEISIYENHPLYDESGIYGIYIDKNLEYIGCSSGLYKRWANQTYSIMNKTHEGTTTAEYIRNAYFSGKTILFYALEFCSETMLQERKKKLILQHKPKLNIISNSKRKQSEKYKNNKYE